MSEEKIGYFIKPPYVSSGLKRTYNKQLEIYSGPIEETGGGFRIESTAVYKYKNGDWKRCQSKYNYVRFKKLFTTINEISTSDNVAYATLELAIAAKLILIQRMARDYESELKRLKELFNRNVPDVTEPLSKIKETNPEYFI